MSSDKPVDPAALDWVADPTRSTSWMAQAQPVVDTSRKPVSRPWRDTDQPPGAKKKRVDRRPGTGIVGGVEIVRDVATQLSQMGHDIEAHKLRQACKQLEYGRQELLAVNKELKDGPPVEPNPDHGIICKQMRCNAYVFRTGRKGRPPVHCPKHMRRT